MFQNINIECQECKRFPLFDIKFENNDCLIKYQCHNKKFEEISLNKFKIFSNDSIKCKECNYKVPEYKCYCGLFCEDDYLLHILISKHERAKKVIKLDKIFKYYCFDCDQIFEDKENHQNHYFLNYEQLIKFFNNYVIFLFKSINKLEYLNNQIIQIFNSIFYISINYIEQGNYKYYLNLQNLIFPIIDILNNNNIDNKNGDFNYIISKYSVERNLNKTIIISKQSEIKEEFCEIYSNKKKIKFEHKLEKEENKIILLFHTLLISTKNMFSDCSSLTSLNLSHFNTINVKDMSHMFYKCSSLTSIILSNFNTNNVKDMSFMFCDCYSLTSLNLYVFNTNNVNNMKGMFSDCRSLTSLNLSNFNTNNVEDMSYMFFKCSSLTSLNLSNFNTNNVNNISFMFSNCSSLIFLNLSNFNADCIKYLSGMFSCLNNSCKIITNDNKILDMIKKIE